MTDSHNRPDVNETLDLAVEAMRDACETNAQPPAELTTATLARLEGRSPSASQSQSQPPTDAAPGAAKPWRHIMFKTAQYGSIAAVLALIAGLFLWLGPGGSTNVAFAEVAKKLDKVKTARFITTMKYGDQPAMTTKQFIRNDGMMRQEMPMGIVMVIDTQKQQGLLIQTQRKIAQRVTFDGLPMQNMMANNPIEQMRKMRNPDAKPIGKERLNGREMLIYEIQQPMLKELNATFKLWVDPKTELPVQVLMTMPVPDTEERATITIDRFVWNEPMDEALFSMEPPEGYQVQDLRFSYEPKTAIVKTLRLYTDVSDGAFPDDMSPGLNVKYVKLLGKKIKGQMTPEQEQSLTQVGIGAQMPLQLKAMDRDWNYAGKGLKIGQGDKPIAWFKTETGQAYVVIMDDLSVREVDEAGLKAIVGKRDN